MKSTQKYKLTIFQLVKNSTENSSKMCNKCVKNVKNIIEQLTIYFEISDLKCICNYLIVIF